MTPYEQIKLLIEQGAFTSKVIYDPADPNAYFTDIAQFERLFRDTIWQLYGIKPVDQVLKLINFCWNFFNKEGLLQVLIAWDMLYTIIAPGKGR